MTGNLRLLLPSASIFALCLSLSGCSDPGSFDANAHPPKDAAPAEEVEVCEASLDWLPSTPELPMFLPIPHPAGECPFYRSGWQNFLVATQPTNAAGRPAIQDFPTIDDVFTSYVPHAKQGTLQRSWLGDIKQAGAREILIDQNGHTLYYGIHMNQAFADFIKTNHLDTPPGIQAAREDLYFTEGLVEFKSAWQEVLDPTSDAETKDFITTKAWVPKIHQNPATKEITEDKDDPREITVRLLALHVVSTLPGHPEFIWASFEHTRAGENDPDVSSFSGFRDLAPNTGVNPLPEDQENLNNNEVPSSTDGILYKAGTSAKQGNRALKEAELVLNEATQSFPGQATSIYRMYPASKSNTTDPDNAITSLNHNVEELFKTASVAPNDKRGHYRLLGAQWMDKPYFFQNKITIQNRPESSALIKNPAGFEAVSQGDERKQALEKAGLTNADTATQTNFAFDQIGADGSDSPFSILAGEDRMSSTAMESFTQSTAAFPNCFSCHNTTAITTNGVPLKNGDTAAVVLLQPKLINVSHIFSQVILEQCTTREMLKTDATGLTTAVCNPM